VFLKDVRTGRVAQLSTGIRGAAPGSWPEDPAITPDGRYVVFVSGATNLVPGAGPGKLHCLALLRGC
jgi:hypothetical protein